MDFTKIEWAGQEVLLVTDRENARHPVCILDREDFEKIVNEWNKKD